MHPIQRAILYQLITNPSLPYSKIKPKEIEGNLFMYHLKQLISQNLVQKFEGEYELTTEGKIFAETISLSDFKPRIQPKIVTLIACKNNKGEYLLYKRNRQPYLGLVGFPYGKIHLGETILQAAQRELQEKTGLSAKLTHRADVYLTTYQNDNLLSQTFCHVFSTVNPVGNLKEDSEIGKCFWAKIKNLSKDQFIPGFIDVYKLVKSSSNHLIFKEYTYPP